VFNFAEWHAAFLNDDPRVAAYQRAIAATVRADDVVLDLGASVLSFNLAQSSAEPASGTSTLTARRSGTLHGIFG
jgi:predicted RNA methylase